MKSLIASLLILLSIACLTVFGSLHISKSLNDINEEIEKINAKENEANEIYKLAQSAEKCFENHKPFILLFLNDKDVDELETLFEDLKSATESESQTDIIKAKRRLMSKIEQMKRLSAFNIDSIF